jgi:protein-histidine pros-kinase
MFGYEAGELTGGQIEQLMPTRFSLAHAEYRRRYFSQPRTRTMGLGLELYGLRKNGTEFPVEISLSPIGTEDGTLVMSAIRDITDRKLAERALQQKNVELAKANKAKDSFLATMSHELRTPLNAVIGFTGTLLMKLPGPLTADQEKQLRTIQSSARHLLALINDLLDVAKIEAGKVELSLEPVNCEIVVEEVVDALRPEAARKGLAFLAELPDSPIVVTTDRRALHQVVLNLTNNGLKFTDAGSVHVVLRRIRNELGRFVEISVTDTGIGIRPEDQAKLFEPFAQLDILRAKTREGSGLGLHLSAKLAGLMGGKIEFRSEFDAGSTFTLVLPER